MAPKILLRNVRNVVKVRNVGILGLIPCRAGSISSHLIVLICQTRPLVVQKLVIPELPVADSRGSDPSGFV